MSPTERRAVPSRARRILAVSRRHALVYTRDFWANSFPTVLEPLVLHDWFTRQAHADPDGAFALACRLHWILLAVGAVTAGAGVLGAHGLLG